MLHRHRLPRSSAAEPVVVLRAFHGQVLRRGVAGRVLIRGYYRAAPLAARFLARHEAA